MTRGVAAAAVFYFANVGVVLWVNSAIGGKEPRAFPPIRPGKHKTPPQMRHVPALAIESPAPKTLTFRGGSTLRSGACRQNRLSRLSEACGKERSGRGYPRNGRPASVFPPATRQPATLGVRFRERLALVARQVGQLGGTLWAQRRAWRGAQSRPSLCPRTCRTWYNPNHARAHRPCEPRCWRHAGDDRLLLRRYRNAAHPRGHHQRPVDRRRDAPGAGYGRRGVLGTT